MQRLAWNIPLGDCLHDLRKLFIDVSTLQELLKKCHQCMETIVKAKDQQAAEANKNASILLKELDLEKVCIFR